MNDRYIGTNLAALAVAAATGSGCSRKSEIDYNSLHYDHYEEMGPSKIVFLRRVDGDGYSEIYAKDADGGNVRKLINYPGIVTPAYEHRFVNPKDRDQTIVCRSQVRELGMAVRMYAREHGDRLPNAESWENDINKYLPVNGSGVVDEEILTCPITDKHYVFNKKLSGADLGDVRKPDQTPLLWEPARDAEGLVGPHEAQFTACYADGRAKFQRRRPPVFVGYVHQELSYLFNLGQNLLQKPSNLRLCWPNDPQHEELVQDRGAVKRSKQAYGESRILAEKE